MPGVAAWLREHHLEVSAFYVSNVEQYLFEPGLWAKWSRNVTAMPVNDASLFIRCYLDQGKRHPKQMKGHRAATTLHSIAAFDAHQEKKPYPSFWAVATDGILDGVPAPEPTASRP
jgi:phosphatidate phosphatase APP1